MLWVTLQCTSIQSGRVILPQQVSTVLRTLIYRLQVTGVLCSACKECSARLGLEDFAIGLVNSVLSLH